MQPTSAHPFPGYVRAAIGAGTVAIVVGLLVLVGWALGQENLKRIVPGLVAMNPLTAAGFILAGLSLLLGCAPPSAAGRGLARGAAVLVTLIGLTKLGEYTFGWNLGFDRWMFRDSLDVSGLLPNRIAPNTALNFVLIGLALAALDLTTARGRRPAEYLAVPVALISLLALFGYAYGVLWLYGVSAFIPMALHTALCFQLLALGVLCARPEQGLMAWVTGRTAAGVLLRRQLPGMVLILFLLGGLRLEGERRGWYGTELGVALHTVVNVVLMGGLIVWSAWLLQRAEEARRREQEERERFFRLALDLLCIAGTDGWFRRVNPAFTATLGWSAEELQARPFLDFVHPEDVPATLAEIEKLRAGQPTVNFENRYRCKDGTWKWLAWKAQPFPAEERLYATAHDVTERKLAEQKIRGLNEALAGRAAELAEVNRELEAFSYSVSHDLRAPLRHIQGYAEMLRTALGEALADPALRYLRTIRQAAEEMGKLIDDLLAFSRVGRVGLQRQQIDLGRLVAEVRQTREFDVKDRRIEWHVGPLPVVGGDPNLLRQVLANLIDNAVKYTRGRDPAVIGIGAETGADGTITVSVRDNGAGFDPRYAGKLFGVFQRLHRVDEFEGTGIGLATVRRIITRHGGRTWAEGRVNEGAVFYFTLPAGGATSASPAPPS